MRKIKPDFDILDYGDERYELKDLGIWFYRERVYHFPDKQENNGLRSYLFRLFIVHSSERYVLNRAPRGELLEFIQTIDLSSLPYTKVKRVWSDTEDYIFFTDWETFLNSYHKEEYDYCKERILRRLRGRIPEPVEYTSTTYLQGKEFLHFTDDTASCWGGPVTQDNRLGCVASILRRREPPSLIRPIIFEKDWCFYSIPYKVRTKLQLTANQVYDMTSTEKRRLWSKFDWYTKLEVCKGLLTSYTNNKYERIWEYFPYSVFLQGNDDTSYTKWFATKKQAEAEMKYLRVMQPLDFIRDIIQRDYIFTN